MKQILSALKNNGFSLNSDKCNYLVNKITYLGRKIENGTVKPSLLKTIVVKESPTPKNVKQVRQFLGLAGYFRKFVKDFSSIVSPISALLKKNAVWNWSEECEAARNIIVNILINSPLLCIYESERETELHTDASSIGLGAVLMQRYDTGMRVVAYYSRKLTLEESKYHSYELETMVCTEISPLAVSSDVS